MIVGYLCYFSAGFGKKTPGEKLEELKTVVDVPKAGNTEADIETLLNLMGSEDKPRAAWPFEC